MCERFASATRLGYSDSVHGSETVSSSRFREGIGLRVAEVAVAFGAAPNLKRALPWESSRVEGTSSRKSRKSLGKSRRDRGEHEQVVKAQRMIAASRIAHVTFSRTSRHPPRAVPADTKDSASAQRTEPLYHSPVSSSRAHDGMNADRLIAPRRHRRMFPRAALCRLPLYPCGAVLCVQT